MKRLFILSVFCFCIAGIFLNASNQEKINLAQINEEIANINQEIKLNGLNWQAGYTSLALLTPEEKRLRLGTKKPIADVSQAKLTEFKPKIKATSWDWRNYNGQNWLTSIKNQGSCGSCWAFATCAILEAMYGITKGSPSALDLAEQHLLSCTGTGNDCGGGYYSSALDYTRYTGLSRETCFPYQAADLACNPCTEWNLNVGRIRVSNYGWITDNVENRPAVMSAIQNGPVISYMEVYTDFYYYTGGVYHRASSATNEGGHAILIVGFNQSEQYWICKNSWGSDWGEDGYFRIGFGEVEIGTYVMWSYGAILQNNAPILGNIANQSVYELGARAAGMKAIWLNRDSSPLPDGIVPDATIHSLAELQDTLAGL